jgi:hypothetical protein
VPNLTLGKEALCRVSTFGKELHCRVSDLALGKAVFVECFFFAEC